MSDVQDKASDELVKDSHSLWETTYKNVLRNFDVRIAEYNEIITLTETMRDRCASTNDTESVDRIEKSLETLHEYLDDEHRERQKVVSTMTMYEFIMAL